MSEQWKVADGKLPGLGLILQDEPIVPVEQQSIVIDLEDGRSFSGTIGEVCDLLARAEAAEERVRLLVGAVAELVDSLHTCESCDGTGKYQDVACDVCGGYGECVSFGAAIEAAVRLRTALATTGVPHG